ncbi:class I adenylate-forming enzyme family protein [Pseudonocardia xishanensis]|uniref:Acyl--CoA ligase n=1 Tax=Pseudonocardia xishanensis TaxID=630995 RepID=A0ABP8S0C9_9PSEU
MIKSFDGLHLGAYAGTAAALYGDRELISDGEHRLTYVEFDAWSRGVARWWHDLGVRRGDPVLMLTPNSIEMMVALAALWRIGAVPAPVVTGYGRHELGQITRGVQPRAVVTSVGGFGSRDTVSELDGLMDRHLTSRPPAVLTDGTREGWQGMPGRPGGEVEVDLTPVASPDSDTDTCLLLHTSGSTAAPKGVELTSRGIHRGLQIFEDRGILGPEDVGMTMSPLSHVSGLVTSFLLQWCLGARTTILRRWAVDNAVDLIARERVTYVGGPMTFLTDLCNHYERVGPGGHRIVKMTSGGAATPPALVERAEQLGIWVGRVYGMTETSGVVSAPYLTSSLVERSTLDGLLDEEAEVRVLDDDGAPLPPGTEGDIHVRGPHVVRGYTDPEATAAQFSDGWFDTGDVGVLSADGWLKITGRTKEIINRGGEKFATRDIEDAIASHPDVATAAVVAVSHERFGEVPCAFVQPRHGAELAPEGLAAYLLDRGLAKAKIPGEFLIVDDLPRSATGKIQRKDLLGLRETLQREPEAGR